MNSQTHIYIKNFTKKAENNGFSAEYIDKCLTYAKPLLNKGLPVIYNPTHLSALVGYEKKYLKRAALNTKYFYRYFSIKKADGKNERTISEPLPSLKEIQDWILIHILYKNKVSKYAKAYCKNRNIKDHVKYHTNSKNVLTLDIKDFFQSISLKRVESLFLEMGYSSLISNLLAKLCCLNDGLPQGAPTSPYLSNLILFYFDEQVSEYCRTFNLKYTRYADDLAFSGNVLVQEEIIAFIKEELSKDGLKLNLKKTKLMKQNQQQVITGLIVNQKTQVPKKERNKIRNEMFYIQKFGIEEHLNHTNQTKQNYLSHLKGKINYILQINPKDSEFIGYRDMLRTIKKDSP